MRKLKKWTGLILASACLFQMNFFTVEAEEYWPSGPEIEGEAAVVMEVSTGAVLYEKNPHEQLYPASITKIMTSLLAVENCSLSEEVTFSHDSVFNIERDSTHIFRDVGEVMTLEQCLYGVMLGSANDCAYAVAEHVGKGYENFINMMNERAAQLGCRDTHFNNPHGLPDENHYTSAYDMALISRAALQNETFRLIAGTKKYTIPFTNKHPDEETPIVNHHKMLAPYKGDSSQLYEYCIGGKTGYTDVARSTLVTFAEKDGMTLVCVVMKEEGTNQYTETRSLLDYCFENFKMWNVSENEPDYAVEGTARPEIFGNSENFVALDANGQIVLPKAAAFEDAQGTVSVEGISEDTVGVLEYTYAGRAVGKIDIKATGARVQQFPFHAAGEQEQSSDGGAVSDSRQQETPEARTASADKKQEEKEEPQPEQGEGSPEKQNEGSSQKTKKISFQLKPKFIALIAVGVIILGAVGVLIFYLFNNFYLIKYKLSSRRERKQKFKIIKPGRHSRWNRRDRW